MLRVALSVGEEVCMNKENTDQVIRCIKECWWRVGVLIGVLFGSVLIAMHGWPQGEWGLGWGAVGAIASLVIGGVTLQINHTQKKWIEQKRGFDREFA